MKIALVTSHPVQYQVPWIRKLADCSGVDLTVLYAMLPTPAQQGADYGLEFTWDQPLLNGYRYVVLKNISKAPSPLYFSGCDTPEIYRIIREGDWDAVIVHGWYLKTCLQALAACRRYKVPCLIRGESSSLQKKPWWKSLLHRFLIKQYAACLSIGTRNTEYYRLRGVPEEKIFSTPYGVDNDRFERQLRSLDSDRGKLREKFGLAKEAIVYLFCARFIEKKRPMDYLDALSRARLGPSVQSEISGLMIGDGPLRKNCESFVQENDLPVKFGGFLNQNEIAQAYVAADCLILPSDSDETWGLVTNEAMACGRPALVSDQVGCAVDLVRPGITGDIFACGDVGQLASLMVKYAEKSELLEHMASGARNHNRSFSPENVVSGIVQALKHISGMNDNQRRSAMTLE